MSGGFPGVPRDWGAPHARIWRGWELLDVPELWEQMWKLSLHVPVLPELHPQSQGRTGSTQDLRICLFQPHLVFRLLEGL